MNKYKPFSVKVVGAFDLLDDQGCSIRPSGRKDCAIIAILALTRNHRQTRTWLQDKLWGDRGPAQGAASLRQALTTLRNILNTGEEVLGADRTWVWLDPKNLDFDHLNGSVSSEILRGFDLRDEGFNDWLRDTRTNIEAGKARWGGPYSQEHLTRRWHLDVEKIQLGDKSIIEIADIVADSLAEVLSVIGVDSTVDRRMVQDAPAPRATDIVVTTRVVDVSGDCLLSIRATDGFGNLQFQLRREADTQAWSHLRTIQIEMAQLFQDYVIKTEANSLKGARWSAHSNGCQALFGILSPGTISIREIRQCSESANAANEKGIYHALLGYSKLLEYGEREGFEQTDYDVVMQSFRLALKMAPANGLVNALVGHSYGFLLRNLEVNLDLTKEAVRLLPGSGVCWIYHSISLAYCGRTSDAVSAAKTAVNFCRGTVAFPLSKAAELYSKLCAGDFKGAISAGETSLEAITFRPAIMDLMTAYSMEGQLSKGHQKLKLLRDREPELCLEKLKSDDYPIVNSSHRELTVYAAQRAGLI